jgi:hypothetical protein
MTLSLALVVPRPAIPPIASREDLIDTLFMAAELEHAIMVQYLYAAFSVDRENRTLAPAHQELARTFVIELLKIARQEMAHLSMVTNLLIAVGAAPDFDRPNLPIQRGYYSMDVRLALLPFSDEFLDLMTKLEEPVARAAPAPDYPTVAAIYDRIEDGVVALGSPGAPTAATLFIGANEPQISGVDFGVGPGQVYYDTILLPVTDLASACAAITLIRVQGEGANATDPNSHFAIVQRLKHLWDGLPPEVKPAIVKPMPKNPLAKQRGDVDPDAECVVLSDPRAVALANAANRTYELLLLLLARLYGANDATAEDREMYRKYAFFPLMTIVIRPVAEIIDDLPAGDGRHCAACTFELDGPIRTFPDRRAFHIQLSERLAHLAAEYGRIAAMPEVSPRLAYVAQNVAYVRDRIDAYIAGRPAT